VSGNAFSPEALAQVQQLDDDGVVAWNNIVFQDSINQAPIANTTILGICVQTQFAGDGNAS
jgi:hypothetical protein